MNEIDHQKQIDKKEFREFPSEKSIRLVVSGFLICSIAYMICLFLIYLKNHTIILPFRKVYVWDQTGTIGIISVVVLIIITILWILFSQKRKMIMILLGIVALVGMIFGLLQTDRLCNGNLRDFSTEMTPKAYQNFFDSSIVLDVEGERYSWDGRSAEIVEPGMERYWNGNMYYTYSEMDVIEFIPQERFIESESYGKKAPFGVIFQDRQTKEIYFEVVSWYTPSVLMLKFSAVDEADR